ncbi:transcriptional regulator Myc-A, partial [Biomphalaria glabrata]
SSSDDSDVESDYSDSSSTLDEEVVNSSDDVDVEGVSSSDEKYYASQALKIKPDVTKVASHVEDHDYAAKPPMLSTQTVHSPQAKTTARSVQEPASWSSTYVNSPRRRAPTVNPPKAKTKARSAEASASLSRARALKTREVYKAFFGSPVRNARNSKPSAYATSAKPKPGTAVHKKESPPIGTKKRGRPPKRVLPESHAAKTSLTKKTKPNTKPNVSILPFTNPLANESVVESTAMRSPDEAHLYVPTRSLMEDKQKRLNDMERRRRRNLKEAFLSLKDLVPSLASVQNAPIQQILKHAVTFIEQLKRREALQQKEIESLMIKKKKLNQHQKYLLLNQ